MEYRSVMLFPHELDALIEAVRRDLRVQQRLARSTTAYQHWHGMNARCLTRILETLNPKRSRSRNDDDESALPAMVLAALEC